METQLSDILAKKGSQVHEIAATVSVREAVGVMNTHTIGSLMVTDGGQPVGIFTERDVLTRVIDAGRDPDATSVAEVMTRNPLCVERSVTIDQAMSIIQQRRFRHLPITDTDGKVIGILSSGDLIAWMVADQEHEIEQLTRYIAGSY